VKHGARHAEPLALDPLDILAVVGITGRSHTIPPNPQSFRFPGVSVILNSRRARSA
jgi:hypothetical protein